VRSSSAAAEAARWADGEPDGRTDDGRILNMEITEKQRAIEALQALPEHATIEDAIERLCFIAKIEEGLRQSDAGQLVSHDEVKKQFLS
jgi:predicted transcriptional regulator